MVDSSQLTVFPHYLIGKRKLNVSKIGAYSNSNEGEKEEQQLFQNPHMLLKRSIIKNKCDLQLVKVSHPHPCNNLCLTVG